MPVFDEHGNEISPDQEHQMQPMDPPPEPPDETDLPEEDSPGPDDATDGKYRIGDKYFDSFEEAHAYATQMQNESTEPNSQFDAYRQGILDAQKATQNPESVTPEPQNEFDEDLYFSNPGEFLKNYAQKIKQETAEEINQNLSMKEQSNQVWNAFTSRHPEFSDFRSETEAFVNQHVQEVQKIIRAKGPEAGYDWVALKMKENSRRLSQLSSPRKTLKNGSGGATPSNPPSSVTPKKSVKKRVSFAEQIRSIKRKG